MHFTTKILHSPYSKKDAHGALRFPTYGNASFEFDSAEDIENAFVGKKYAHTYSRSTNPTVDYLEKTIALVTNAQGVIGFSSGMAAISNTILGIAQQGDEIISSNKLFGTTYSFFKETLPRFGITVKFIDFQDIDAIKKAITPHTRAIFFESITNPQIEIFSITEIVKLAKEHKILTILDTTATPLYTCNIKELEINIAVLSSTKFISGGATAIGGILIDLGNFDWKKNPYLKKESKQFGAFTFLRKLRTETYRNLGACMSPDSARAFSLGLETMELRIERACSNAQKIAEFLTKQKSVSKVRYAGLKENKFYPRSQKYFVNPGAVICFELTSKQKCYNLINSVQLIRRATNIHDNKTLIIHPASTIYCDFTEQERISMDVQDTMIRLSVGIENFEDIRSDLTQALEKL